MKEVMPMVMGLILIVVAFILFPMITTASDTIGSANLTNMTGLDSMRTVGPTILFAGLLFGGGLLSWTGVRGMRSKGRR